MSDPLPLPPTMPRTSSFIEYGPPVVYGWRREPLPPSRQIPARCGPGRYLVPGGSVEWNDGWRDLRFNPPSPDHVMALDAYGQAWMWRKSSMVEEWDDATREAAMKFFARKL